MKRVCSKEKRNETCVQKKKVQIESNDIKKQNITKFSNLLKEANDGVEISKKQIEVAELSHKTILQIQADLKAGSTTLEKLVHNYLHKIEANKHLNAFLEVFAEEAIEKLNVGASLVQLYTGFIYEGPGLIRKINKALLKR